MANMMKLAALLFMFLVKCSVGDDDHGTNTISYTSDTFSDEIAKKPHFVMFFAPWCGHCKRLAPTWDELARKYNADPEKADVLIGKVDCTEQTPLCSEHGVTGYPTLKFFKASTDSANRYKGPRDQESIEAFIREQMNEKPEDQDAQTDVPSPKPALVDLDTYTFDAHIETGFHFIKFFAPWCGHCQRLAPTWEQLANTFEDDASVSIAKVDCTQHREVCGKYGVQGYPTLIWFADGKKMDSYQGSRDHDALEKFVSDNKQRGDADKLATDEKIPHMAEEAKESEEAKEGEEPKDTEDEVSDVVTLTSDTYDDGIAKGITFVKFYAPWCGFCKRLAPTWNELGTKFANNAKVTIAKLDCTVDREPCNKNEVRGYPTLIMFRDGEKVSEYDGERDLEELFKFTNDVIPHDEL